MTGKSDPDAAAQEALEEAGVQGRIDPISIGSYAYQKRSKSGGRRAAVVDVYALEVLIQLGEWPEDGERRRCWMSVEAAAQAVREPGLCALLGRLAA